MGKVLGGGSKQSSTQTSSNQAFGAVNNAMAPLMGQAQAGGQGLKALLGGDASGFNKFKSATGFDGAMEQGSRGITGNAAASGMLRSGSTSKALSAFGNQMQNQYANNYMDKLLAQANMGFQAGNLLTQAGQTSQSQSSGKSKGGIGGTLGAAASLAAASDRRLKKNIHKVGELSNGLGVYQYRYINDKGPYIGVMADEVETLMPEALGPEIDGYKTVDYAKIKEVV